jgi:hypothetical protein
MKYKPFKEQQFWGDTWAALSSRVKSITHEENKVLGRPVNSGIDYSDLIREQACPVIPIHLSSFREEKSITLLIEGHPYWQMFEFGSFEFNGREIRFCWPSSFSGRQVFVTSEKELYDFFRDHMGGIEVQYKPIVLEEQELSNGKKGCNLKTELPSGEDFEAYLEYKSKPMKVERGMVPYDNHSQDKALIAGGIKGEGRLGNPKSSWLKINGVKHGFGKAINLIPLIVLGDINVIFGGVMSYDREAKLSGDSFSIVNPANDSKIDYSIKKSKDEVEYVNTGPLNESRIKARLVGKAEEIYEIKNNMANQDALSIKVNPSLPDLRYNFREPYVGKFFLSAGDFKGIVIGSVQAKHLGKFIVFDFLPERPKAAKRRSIQTSVLFASKDEYKIRSQIYSP